MRLTITVEADAWERLVPQAVTAHRDPEGQASILLRQALGFRPPQFVVCAGCGKAIDIAGSRRDRRYCNTACRMRAAEARKRAVLP